MNGLASFSCQICIVVVESNVRRIQVYWIMVTKPTALAFVDIETTGSQFQHDEIIEIAIIRFSGGQITEFQQLFKPQEAIPKFIQQLTNISNDNVQSQPKIETCLDTIQEMLQDALFIAHNVSFDFNFIQHLFHKNQRQLNNILLCSYQLAKYLYPEDKKHGLDFLIEKHDINIPYRHRAYGDVLAIYQFCNIIRQEFTPDILENAIKTVIKQKNPTANLNHNDISKLRHHITKLPKSFDHCPHLY